MALTVRAMAKVTMWEAVEDGVLLRNGGSGLNASMGFLLYAMVLVLTRRRGQPINAAQECERLGDIEAVCLAALTVHSTNCHVLPVEPNLASSSILLVNR